MPLSLAGILLPLSLFKRLIADLDSGAKLKHHGMQEGRGGLARPPGWPTDGAEVPPEHAAAAASAAPEPVLYL